MLPSRIIFAALFSSLLVPALARAQSDVFWEAEDAATTTMTTEGSYRPLTPEESAVVSNGAWLNGNVGDDELSADYEIAVPAAGKFNFYVRKYWQHGAFRWSVDGGAWNEVRKTDLIDAAVLREYVPLCWVALGDLELTKGSHKLRLEVVNDPNYEFSKSFGFDCFLLTQGEIHEYLETHREIAGEPK